jgi:hypothetical protein
MWPFSLVTLRRELNEYRSLALRLTKEARDASDREEALKTHNHRLMGDFLRVSGELTNSERVARRLAQEVTRLIAELKQAQKNDSPKNAKGRFTKKADNV